MQRSAVTSMVSVVVASLFALVGAVLVVRTRDETTVRSARLAFLGSALIWWWCSTLFYAGFGMRIADNIASGPRTLTLAVQAIDATLRPDLFGVLALLLVGMTVWRRPNRVALWMLLTFWGTLQTAKLNVFMGVRNSGIDWLPDHLVGLSRYFGPPQNSPLLPATIALLTIGFLIVTVRAWNAPGAFRTHMLAMIAFLLSLALLEHALLGVNLTPPLWDIFRPIP